jgi:hypothetical protein
LGSTPLFLVPHSSAANGLREEFAPPSLTVIAGGKTAQMKALVEEPRRDGVAVVVECAAELEWVCQVFKLEANERAILDVEPHLRRVTRAANQLTREAARVRRKQLMNESDDSLFLELEMNNSNEHSVRIPVFNNLDAAVEYLKRRRER